MSDKSGDSLAGLVAPYISVQQLSRFAEDLPENYKDLADQSLCESIAQSFAAHIENFAQEIGQAVTVAVSLPAPPSVEITRADGSSIDISFFGDEAFDLEFARASGSSSISSENELEIWQRWPGLDRSGLVFLSHMFVETGELEVPTGDASGLVLD